MTKATRKESHEAFKKRYWIPVQGIDGLSTWENVNDGDKCHFIRIERDVPLPVRAGYKERYDHEDETATLCSFCGSHKIFRYVYDSYLYDWVFLCVPCMEKILAAVKIEMESKK